MVAEYRCAEQECTGGGLMCKVCVLSAHRLLPLHWIEVRSLISCVSESFSSVFSVGMGVILSLRPYEILDCRFS